MVFKVAAASGAGCGGELVMGGGVGVPARLGAGRSCAWGMGRVPCTGSGGRDDSLSSPYGGGRGTFVFLVFFLRAGAGGVGFASYFSSCFFFSVWWVVKMYSKASVWTLAPGLGRPGASSTEPKSFSNRIC
jgi:hypothetical protein